MKKLLILFTFNFLLFTSQFVTAQNVGIGTNTPNPSAQLDVASTNKGFLPPRMTYAQRNSIVNPAAGLIVYCTDCGAKGELQGYNGSEWTNMIGGPTQAALAVVSTTAVSSITETAAISGGNITSDGGGTVTARGVVWGTSVNPTITLATKTTDGIGTGVFTSNITGLTATTTYYMRAYATNSVGTTYGNELTFTTSAPLTSVKDIDNNIYPIVKIGNQTWMAENLRTRKYSDGSNIPVVTDNIQWENNYNNSTTLPMMCWYNNDEVTYNANKFGALYNWYVINPATNGNKNVCPTGWHVPSDAEWNVLIANLDPSYNPTAQGFQSTTAGGYMKNTGTQYWISPNTGATNSSGWSGLPVGYRGVDGTFGSGGYGGGWWSSTDINISYVWYRNLYYNSAGVGRNINHMSGGFSVRCIKD